MNTDYCKSKIKSTVRNWLNLKDWVYKKFFIIILFYAINLSNILTI